MSVFARIRQHLARRRLQRIVSATAQSREIIDYRIHRARAKAGWRTRRSHLEGGA